MELDKIETKINNLPTAEERDLFEGKEETELEGRKAIWNVTDDRLAEVVSDKYTIVQHEDFFPQLTEALTLSGHEIKEVEVKDDREVVFLEAIFDREKIAEGIFTGIRAGNSFNRTCRAFVEAYAFRVICSNGLIGKEIFGRAGAIHVGAVDARDLIDKIENQLPVAEKKVRELREKALGAHIEIDEAEQLFVELNVGKRHKEYVFSQIDANNTDVWNLYNLTTEYIENEMERSELGRADAHRSANKILLSVGEDL